MEQYVNYLMDVKLCMHECVGTSIVCLHECVFLSFNHEVYLFVMYWICNIIV